MAKDRVYLRIPIQNSDEFEEVSTALLRHGYFAGLNQTNSYLQASYITPDGIRLTASCKSNLEHPVSNHNCLVAVSASPSSRVSFKSIDSFAEIFLESEDIKKFRNH